MAKRLTVISADGHVGGRPEEYRPYIEPRFRDKIDDLIAEDAHWNRVIGCEQVAADPEFCGWNMANRIASLDADGITAEIEHAGVQGASLPFFSNSCQPKPFDVRDAGARAFNRWLSDHMADASGRLLGVAALGPCFDIAATCAEIRWAADHGFVSAQLPQTTYEPALPPIYDAYYEPVWATCAELGLPLSIHAGWGVEQGKFWEYVSKFLEMTGQSADFVLERAPMEMLSRISEVEDRRDDDGVDVLMMPRRGLWQLMISGVFDRHPTLKVATTELRADWVPGTLAALDKRCRQKRPKIKMLPSEYFARNCFVTPSSIRESEIAMRREIGVDRLMFGTDCPHHEATWPETPAWIRHTFRGLSEDEARAILGENAIRCYGLDRAPLDALAARIGPTLEEVLSGPPVDVALLDKFHSRGGLRHPAERVDANVVEQMLDKDLARINA